MVTVTVKQAKAQIGSLLERVAEGEEVVITQDDAPMARIVSASGKPSLPKNTKMPEPGNAKGDLLYMAADFDGPLDIETRNRAILRILEGGVGANITAQEIREFIDEGRP